MNTIKGKITELEAEKIRHEVEEEKIWADIQEMAKARRAASGLRLREVAEQSGASIALVSYLETGGQRIGLDSLSRIANVLDIKPIK